MSSKDDVIRGQEWAGMALVHESERLRGLLEHAEEANGELTVEREKLRAENERLREQVLNQEAEIEGLEAARTGDDMAIEILRTENKQLLAALKVHHDLGLWSVGHKICPECGQTC